MKKLLSVLLLVCMVLSLASCSAGSKTAATSTPASAAPSAAQTQSGPVSEVKIGVILPFTGGSAFMGNTQFEGVKLAADYINANGGIKSLGGAKITLVKADSQGKAEVGVTEAERLIVQEKVSALIGTYNSGVASAVGPIAIKYKTPFQVINAVSDGILSDNSNYLFRANPCDSSLVPGNAEFYQYLRDLSGTPINMSAFIYDQSDYGKGLFETNSKNLDKYKFEYLGVPVQAGTSDLSSAILKVKSSKANIVEPCVGIDEGLTFIRQMKEYDVNLSIITNGGPFATQDFIDKAGELAEYTFSIGHTFPAGMAKVGPNPELVKEISTKFKDEMGYDIDFIACNGWLGMQCLADAIERAASTDRQAIADAMDATDIKADHVALIFHGYDGVKYTDDIPGVYNQNCYGITFYAQVQDGAYRIVFPAKYADPDFKVVFPVPAWKDR